ncbi:SGNH/GDSL hydrolase family protein [Dyadobacter aurulentus]|uniref:SGNH/GDSL hydrolase family protein n=1 Tax=Dyadobacter sp. UC 10 TaxID=2605428 RepID=UPI0011F1CF21|nr:SGNH/GDSL hydrolase family protein [Dyadobacter sp. UC 10]KAA0993837.1 hypothetical protein FXO21_28475 [Dyadobacter sp. UC 10]
MKKLLIVFALVACNKPTNSWPDPKPVEPVYIPTAEDSAKTAGPFMGIHPMGQYPEMIYENLQKQPALKIEDWLSAPVPLADFGRILKLGQEMEMVAFGGGLTAGVMNGGITRESQQTNYTNLLAHQMGIKNFAMPLFEKEHFNGTGYYVYRKTEDGYPQWDRVVNNTISVVPGSPAKMPRYAGKISNYGLYWGGTEWYVPGWGCENCALPTLLASRFEGHVPTDLPYNFIIIEEFFDRWMQGIRLTPNIGRWDYSFNGSVMNTGRIEDYSINYLLHGKKGVIFTVPRYQDLPYMNWYPMKNFKSVYISFNRNGVGDGVINTSKPFSLIPTPELDRRCKKYAGEHFTANFDDIEVIDNGEAYESDPATYYNQKIRDYAAEKDLAVVDLFDLYQRIHQGGYRTDDGVLVDGGPYGNFFSSDGIYPTPLGQAIITNEVIKALNKYYGAKIPLIDIAGYVKSVEPMK